MLKRSLSAAMISLAVLGSSLAGEWNNKFIYSPQIGYHMYDEERTAKFRGMEYGLKNHVTGGAILEKIFNQFGVGFMFSYGKTELERVHALRDSYDWAIFGTYNEPVNEKLAPYVSLGIGGNALNHRTLTGIYAALGIRYLIWQNIGVRLAIQGMNLWKGRYDFIPTIGMNIVFGGTADSDRDGIPDDRDMCPNTPIGVKVNANGCPVDSDKDGIPDYKDNCPDTPAGVKVDERGCPVDSDGDGVPDYKDRCPDTEWGAKVDEYGCPIVVIKDSDGDGVPDERDRCPDTPRGVEVDERGCPVDSDGDGVPDYMDRCPNTPKGYKVDEKGCFQEVRLEIYFDTNSWEVKPEYYPILERFAKFLKENPNIKVEIQGHTDTRGPASYNLKLSQKRAEAVKRILVEKFGISPDRIIAKGYGESQPICHEDTEECHAKNRRVVAKIIK
ncbi:MAG: OmpA family protein [Aquificae bacterium]|nr:OmpA family protein [Aquificota bacterium]